MFKTVKKNIRVERVTDKTARVVMILFSALFFMRVTTVFIADRLCSISMAAEKGRISANRAITLLDLAAGLDSTNADIYFKKYKFLGSQPGKTGSRPLRQQQLRLLRRCVNLRPSWPAYHLYYALTLKRTRPRPNIQTRRLILDQLEQAAELKPYSRLYRSILKKYHPTEAARPKTR